MPLAKGDKLGPYEIVEPIGKGGMGEVYRARDPRMGRDVAIKVSAARFSGRFDREVQAIAALNHPNICQIFDVGPDYIVMEYVEGSPLAGPLATEQALPLALQIAAALEAAHAKGIVHRDLKPSNILVSANGAKLLDFGLAKLTRAAGADADATVTQTQAGTVLGTAAYMSPEQAAGKPADARSDIFSFGAVLYELLAGRRAFRGETQVTTMAAVLHTEPGPLEAAPELAAIVTRCLRKSPAERFPSAADLKAALAAVNISKAETPSIAVLPFVNMSADKENEYFSDGLSEEIINLLAKIPGLRVIARTSAFHFRGEHDLRKVGEALNVAHVLEGSVRKSGSRLRITAQLIKVADNSHLWSERYDRQMADVFEIQDEISAAIVDQLKLSLGTQPRAKAPVVNLAAYQALLEGRHHSHQVNPATASLALQCFERAISLDPSYADAHAALAVYYFLAAGFGTAEPRMLLAKGRRAAERALQLDPNNGLAHSYIATCYVWLDYDWPNAERHFQEGLRLAPSDASSHSTYAMWGLAPQRRHAEAWPHIDRAVELDPLSPFYRTNQATLALLSRNPEGAEAVCRRVLQSAPGHMLALLTLVMALGAQGRFAESVQTAEQMVAIYERTALPLAVLGSSQALAGETHEARAILDKLEQQRRTTYISSAWIAVTYAGLGDLDAAFLWANRAVDERDPYMLYIQNWFYLDSLRQDPRYPALLARMNLA
jgi:eukaryotic-like serine/threonine-protein kinase